MVKQMKQSVLSGMLIGIGVIINILSENKYAGAMLFSFALLTIIQNKMPLYTGKIGFIRENKITDLGIILVFNLIGAALPTLMALYCKKDLYDTMTAIADKKFSFAWSQLFFLGFLCGVLMFIAVYTKREIVTVFCIMIFILSGYEHCIADFPSLIVAFSPMRLFQFLCIVLGNSCGSIISYILMDCKKE